MAMYDNDFETRKNETNFLLSQSRKKMTAHGLYTVCRSLTIFE